MSARLPRLTSRARSAAAVAVAASTLVVGVGLSDATAATAGSRAASASSVKVAAKVPHARQRVVFLFHSSFKVGARSRWTVSFGDHYVVTGKGRPPAKAWHVFGASGRYAVWFTMVDATGAKHTAKVMVAIAKAVRGVSAPLGASGVVGTGGASSTTLNGVVVTTVLPPAPPSTSVPVAAIPITSVPTTAVPTTSAPVVVPTTIPTVVPTTIPTVIPTTVPPVVAPVVSLLLGLNAGGLLHGSLLNFTTTTVQGSSAIAGWTVAWGDTTTSAGTGSAPTALTHTYSGIGTHTARLTETAVDGATALSTNLVFLTI
jgi:hypothetical protein